VKAKVALPKDQEYRPIETESGGFYLGEDVVKDIDALPILVNHFNRVPFHSFLGLELAAIDGKRIIAVIEKAMCLYGHFGLMHGGVIAACFDAVGACHAFYEFYRHSGGASLSELMQRHARLRTKVMRVEYLSAPCHEFFQITALGLNQNCEGLVSEMTMVDNRGRKIARATASYVELTDLRTRLKSS
jgi:acyl-coenzyme A thioesterase PaaI-like protein